MFKQLFDSAQKGPPSESASKHPTQSSTKNAPDSTMKRRSLKRKRAKQKKGQVVEKSSSDFGSGAKASRPSSPEEQQKKNEDGHGHENENEEKHSKKKRPKKAGIIVNPSARNKRGPPSQAALALSASLKELSSRKCLEEALRLYWDPSYDNVRDGHHGCAMVDCCARCGAIEEAEKIVGTMQSDGIHVNVETQTALLKGYGHAGLIHKAAELYESMCKAKDKRDRPNVRTLNTLLRGCLWTAATIFSKPNGESAVAGGVVTSEEAWNMSVKREEVGFIMPDSSSFEYSVILLCQALRCDEAEQRIAQMRELCQFHLDGSAEELQIRCDDWSVLESIAVCYLALSRAFAVLLFLQDDGPRLQQKELERASGFEASEILPSRLVPQKGTAPKVTVYAGNPSEAVGHSLTPATSSNHGVSYFDRLWRTGAGSHASAKTRFVIAMQSL